MPTMDLDATIRDIFRRDPRFRPEAYHFLLDALDRTLRGIEGAKAPGRGNRPPSAPPPPSGGRPRGHARERTAEGGVPWNVTGRDLLEGFRELALDEFGALAREVLRFWGLTRTEDVGFVVFNMVEAGLLQKTPHDSPADFRGVFEFESAFDRGFRERLRAEEVRIADPRTG